jgi:hypothetical protein
LRGGCSLFPRRRPLAAATVPRARGQKHGGAAAEVVDQKSRDESKTAAASAGPRGPSFLLVASVPFVPAVVVRGSYDWGKAVP